MYLISCASNVTKQAKENNRNMRQVGITRAIPSTEMLQISPSFYLVPRHPRRDILRAALSHHIPPPPITMNCVPDIAPPNTEPPAVRSSRTGQYNLGL